jgi:mRNA-degrading endonuclease RelE of RelBE toxin-antitoxin system
MGMNFRIADTFTNSLARLTTDEQKAVKTTAFDLQMNLDSPGLKFHRLAKSKDKAFWSVRVSADIRLIVHRTASSILLCYVDHHDNAYDWAARRKVETHPTTGAAQLVEIRETIREVVVPTYVQGDVAVTPKERPFASTPTDVLLGYGVPSEWIEDVRQCDEETLLVLTDRLPGEAAEALLELATGGQPRRHSAPAATTDPFDHPDAQRRFRIMTNVEELERALEYPWEKWTVFLHPEQRQWVDASFNGPARVSGSAGTGKTIVALHRAVHLARSNADSRVLLATFSETLAHALQTKLRRLIGNEPRLAERIDVLSLDAMGVRLHKALIGPIKVATREEVRSLIDAGCRAVEAHKFTQHFLLAEWEQVVDAWQLRTWDDYRDVARLGRRTRLTEARRQVLWSILSEVWVALREKGLMTPSGMFTALSTALGANAHPPYQFAVIDEAQDLSVAQLRFFAALGGGSPNALFFAGDQGQRIFQQPFSWRSLGVDIRGRSRTLRINYRTSHQIRRQADLLLAPEVVDIDGNREDRSDTVSVFNGPPPVIRIFNSESEEADAVATWIKGQSQAGVLPHAISVFVRSPDQLNRARAAVDLSGLNHRILDDHVETTVNHVSICTMHLAKGLEFSAVAVMACDDEIVPLLSRLEETGDQGDLPEAYDSERQLLYVACTRARDNLLVTAVAPASEFLTDLRG